MAFTIRTYGDPVLKAKAAPITEVDGKLMRLEPRPSVLELPGARRHEAHATGRGPAVCGACDDRMSVL
jgi:hypothetical protein